MELNLRDKHVFVAGASRGIGEGIVRAFLNEGARVSLTARTAGPLEEKRQELAKAYGEDRVWAKAGDMTRTADIAAALDGAQAALGPAHVAVANVGVDSSPFGYDVPDDKWESGIDQNFLSGARLAREWMRRTMDRPADERQGANLILISSIAGVNSMGTTISYGTMKAATNHLAKELARVSGRHGIRINAIAPGNILFPGGAWDTNTKARPDDWSRWVKREVALRRFGTVDEIANAALFLASDKASFVTGSVMVVDGGQVK
jgi:3-oxoacyl-[acyl-carrier protein] reductase